MTSRDRWIRRTSRGRGVALTLAVVATVALLLAPVAHQVQYGTFVVTADPERIDWCGRRYHHSSETSVSMADIEGQPAALAGDDPYPVTTVARVPPIVGRPVVAAVTPPLRRQQAGVPCAMTLFLRSGEDRYLTYELSGGP